jgi:hypothetical protein
MNPIEQVIYGATYAQHLAERLADVPTRKDLDKWELECAVSAVEAATYAVQRFREARPQVIEGFKGSSVHKLYVVATKR